MKSTTQWCCLLATLVALTVPAGMAAVAADLPEAPKVSTFAPAEDLASQLEAYVEELVGAVKTEAEYKDSAAKLTKDANTVLLIALGLGLHDSDNKYKQAAPALVEAAKKVMAAKDLKAAQVGVEAVKAAMTSKGDPSKLSWADAKEASLTELMLQVPLINSKMKRFLRGPRFKDKAPETTGQSAVIAVIGQGSVPLAEKTKKPTEAEAWYKHCAEMRTAAAAVNAAIHAQDEKAADKAMKELTQSCDDCHAVFNPAANK